VRAFSTARSERRLCGERALSQRRRRGWAACGPVHRGVGSGWAGWVGGSHSRPVPPALARDLLARRGGQIPAFRAALLARAGFRPVTRQVPALAAGACRQCWNLPRSAGIRARSALGAVWVEAVWVEAVWMEAVWMEAVWVEAVRVVGRRAGTPGGTAVAAAAALGIHASQTRPAAPGPTDAAEGGPYSGVMQLVVVILGDHALARRAPPARLHRRSADGVLGCDGVPGVTRSPAGDQAQGAGQLLAGRG
jgi:hypothetical protein